MREDRPFVKVLGLPDREKRLPGHLVLVGAVPIRARRTEGIREHGHLVVFRDEATVENPV
jgi:hypothetical protein